MAAESVVAYTGLAPQIVEIESDAATAAFYLGDLVKCSSGELVIATTGAILGIAKKASVTGNDQKIPVELINPQEIYVIKYYTTTAETLIGESRAITFTVDAHVVAADSGSPGALDVYIVGLHPDDAEGTDGGRLLVRFEGTILEGV
jgi:hypothetical protein